MGSEGVSDGKLTILVGGEGSVSVIAGVSIDVAMVGTAADCVGCTVGLAGAHPAKAKTEINNRDNNDNGFIINDLSSYFTSLGIDIWLKCVGYICNHSCSHWIV